MTSTPQRVLVVHCPAWSGEDAQPRAFEQIVTAVQEFCPQVEVLTPGTCAISARGPARYFGGEAQLATKIAEAVTRLGFACRVSIADGVFAAELAATHGPPAARRPASSAAAPAACTAAGDNAPASFRLASSAAVPVSPAGSPSAVIIVPAGGTPGFLAAYPVAVLGDPDLSGLLPWLGIETLGQLAALSAAETLNRFGTSGRLAHRLASGLDRRPLVPRPPSADLSVQAEFDPAVTEAEPVIFAAKSLAARLHARLAASGLVCVRLHVQVCCDDGTEIARLWRHDGLLSELAVAERVRWQLDGWRTRSNLSALPGSVVTGSASATVAGGGLPAGGGPVTPLPGDIPAGSARTAADSRDDPPTAAITLLRLIPDQLVPDYGRQLGLWGDAIVSDRVARAALRVQALLGHTAVRQPVMAGGRSPAEQALLVPFGDSLMPERPADRPWPGKIPAPAPATVFPQPRPAAVTDGGGLLVTVTGRAQVSASPARLSVAGCPSLTVTAWAGPWPVIEQWWDPLRACRKARFQLVTEDGSAWLAVVSSGCWQVEGSYD